MLKIISQPYPHDFNIRRLFVSVICIGVFISTFLMVFEPFGLNKFPANSFKYFFLSGFGVITIFTSIIYHLLSRFSFKKWHDEKNWTTGKEIVNILVGIFIVSLLNMVYTNFIYERTFSAIQIPYWAGITLLVGIFPISFSVLLKYSRLKVANEGMASQINDEIQQQEVSENTQKNEKDLFLKFKSENEKEILEKKIHDLLFIEAADNYSTFYFFDDKNVKKEMLRGSLKKMEEQISHPAFFRCHRTYIVNLSNVISVSGNAQGYRLNFRNSDLTVPVSRNLGKELKEKLHKNR